MTSTTADKFPLTWKAYGKIRGKKVSGGQWVKKINGKQKSFGASPRKNDRDAREAALANYLLSQQDSKLAEMAQRYFREQAEKLGLNPDDPRDPRELADAENRAAEARLEALLYDEDQDPASIRYEQQEALRRLQQLIERPRQGQSPRAAAVEVQLSFSEVAEKYLDARRMDYKLTRAIRFTDGVKQHAA